ncbi:MAG: peptide chain release factor 1 [Nitrospinae bacterium]|nr:peptide chain release factor 1 [Nitrospinota bacterium]
MFDKLKTLERRYDELADLLCRPETSANQELFRKYGKEHSDLSETVAAFREHQKLKEQFEGNREMITGGDAELAALAEEENKSLAPKLAALEEKLKELLVPKDPLDVKNLIMEIRAGTGGDEAGLFAAELFNMYSRFAAQKGLKVETMSVSPNQAGGIKEVIATIEGKGAYGLFKYESGVHRVQRVPKTETQGRIHTSTVTVAILAEAEEKEVHLNPNDLRVDVFRSSGPGGQSVNTTDSAVRITHLPTGMVVSMQDEKSQIKNRAKAMRVLLSRLQDFYRSQEKEKESQARKSQIGSGERSEKIRTYNFPQGRLTDHRINLSLFNLQEIMAGELDELADNLRLSAQGKMLAAAARGDGGESDN